MSDIYRWIEKTSIEGVDELSSIVFNTNTLSKVATRSLNQSGERLTNHTRKLSTGSRISKAGDDVASMSIAAKLDTQLRGISKAKQNILDGIGQMETAYGASLQSLDNLQRIRELFVQGINGTNSVDEKDSLQREINGLVSSQLAISDQTKIITSPFANFEFDRIVGHNDNSGIQFFFSRYQTGANDDEIHAAVFISPSGPGSEGSSISLDPGSGFGSANGPGSGINFSLVRENSLIALKIPGASVEPDTLALTASNPNPRTDDGEFGTNPARQNTDTLEHLDTMISNVTRINSVVDSEIVALKSRFDYLEAKEISLNES
ncbi:MAG: flagellin [Candidatus Caenarcaniphilales bacterium]|nr:flagellin [Candidatus Caenarcaniphilales bacterium]